MKIFNKYLLFAKVVPAAANMLEMTYDRKLEKIARNHVRKCNATSSPREDRTHHKFDVVAESGYMRLGGSEEATFLEVMREAIKRKSDEAPLFQYSANSCVKNGQFAHWTVCEDYRVMVTANTYAVGCAGGIEIIPKRYNCI